MSSTGYVVAAGDAEGAAYSRRMRNSVIGLVVVVVAVAGLVAALPGLDEIKAQIGRASVGWLLVALVLELLSCVGYVLTVQLAFPRGRSRPIARLAWTELAANSVMPAGGLGGLGVGAWVLRRKGVSTRRITERSTVVFFLTSAVNVAVLILAGVALGTGLVPGPRDVALTWGPVVVGVAAIVATLAGTRWVDRIARRTRRERVAIVLASLGTGVTATLEELRRRDWKLVGAVGYFAFDVAALVAAFAALGDVPAIAAITMAYLVGQLAGILPIPGGLGAVDGGLVGALVLYGVPLAPAAAAVLLYRAIALLLPTILGAIAFYFLRRDLDKPPMLKPGAENG